MFQLLQKYCTLVEVAVCCVEVNFILKCNWFHKMVSPMGRCLIFLVTIRRILYETTFTTLSVLRNSICYREVSAIIHVCYKEVSLYDLFIKQPGDISLWAKRCQPKDLSIDTKRQFKKDAPCYNIITFMTFHIKIS